MYMLLLNKKVTEYRWTIFAKKMHLKIILINILSYQNTIFLFIVNYTCWGSLCSDRKFRETHFILDFYMFACLSRFST